MLYNVWNTANIDHISKNVGGISIETFNFKNLTLHPRREEHLKTLLKVCHAMVVLKISWTFVAHTFVFKHHSATMSMFFIVIGKYLSAIIT